MIFHVVWLEQALNELADIWTTADSSLRKAITEATNLLDQVLRADPFGSSESRSGKRRILFQRPLGVNIEVDLETKTVWVLNVWHIKARG